MGPHLTRNARDLRAHRAPPRPESDLPRTAGAVVPAPQAVALRDAIESGGESTWATTGLDPESAERSRRRLLFRRHDAAYRGAREDALFHLPQDGRKTPELCPGDRHLRLS